MFKTKIETSYTKKNNTHIFNVEKHIKLSIEEKYILCVQRKFNERTHTLKEYFLKERKYLGMKNTMYGKSKNKENWTIKMYNYRENEDYTYYNDAFVVREYTEDYKRFTDYFSDCPIFQDSVGNQDIEKSIKDHTKEKLKEIFKTDGLDGFFNLNGEEPILSQEGNTGQYLGSCFQDEFFVSE